MSTTIDTSHEADRMSTARKVAVARVCIERVRNFDVDLKKQY